MKKLFKLFLYLGILVLGAKLGEAQQNNFSPQGSAASGAPSGSCSGAQYYVNTANGNLYTCNAGSWAQVSGGSGISSAALQVNSASSCGAQAITGSPITTSGTFIDTWTGTNGDVLTFNSSGCPQDSSTLLSALLLSATAASTYAPLASPTFTGTVTGPWTTAGVVTTTSGGVTSSQPIAGSAAGIVSGPTTTTNTDFPEYNGTTGGTVDSQIKVPALANMVYNTNSGSVNANVSATSMVSSTSAQHAYLFGVQVSLSAIGVGCSGNTTLTVNAIYTDPNGSSATTTAILNAITIANSGNGTLGSVTGGNTTYFMVAKTTTAVQYSTTYTEGSGCTTGPKYTVFLSLDQLW